MASSIGRATDVPWAIIFPEWRRRCRATRASSTRRSSKGSSCSSCCASSPTASTSSPSRASSPAPSPPATALARTFVEFFREPDIQIGYLSGGLTMGMLLSIPMIFAGVARHDLGVAAEARRRRGARVTPLAERLAAPHPRRRADHGRRLHGRLPRRPGPRLLHAARAVRPRRRFRHRAGGQPDLRRADRRSGRSRPGRRWARRRHSSSPSSARVAAR